MFRNDNDVNRCLGIDIPKGVGQVVLVDFFGSPFPAEDFIEGGCGSSSVVFGGFVLGGGFFSGGYFVGHVVVFFVAFVGDMEAGGGGVWEGRGMARVEEVSFERNGRDNGHGCEGLAQKPR